MKKISVASMVAICAGALFGATSSTPVGWTDDYDAALKRAATEKKTVLADFSGSDWCGWCRKLDKEVFDTDVFRKAAAEKYVLLFIDSPQDETKLSAEAKKRNPELVKKYKIRGFPSVLLMDAQGQVLAQTGYQKGGPEAYLKHLEGLLKDAPKTMKFIKPIQDMMYELNDKMEAEMEAEQNKLLKKFPYPPAMATDEAKKEWEANVRPKAEKLALETLEKYIPLYEKAIAAAKATKADADMEGRKAAFIAEQEKKLAQMKRTSELLTKGLQQKSAKK